MSVAIVTPPVKESAVRIVLEAGWAPEAAGHYRRVSSALSQGTLIVKLLVGTTIPVKKICQHHGVSVAY
jgi:hypothetical protein